MEQHKQKKAWNEIRAGSKITLSKDTEFKALSEGENNFIISKGSFFINGFWANATGISKIRNSGINDFGFYSIELKKFNEVEG